MTETAASRSGPLSGLRVPELCAFVAAPLAGLTLAQFGAEVTRVDLPGGNADVRSSPLRLSAFERITSAAAPELGRDTDALRSEARGAR